MEIKTKYNIGDEVWFMKSNRVAFGHIYSIQVGISPIIKEGELKGHNKSVSYYLSHEGSSNYPGKCLFESKQSLIDSL